MICIAVAVAKIASALATVKEGDLPDGRARHMSDRSNLAGGWRLANRMRVLAAPTIASGYYPVFRDFAGSQHLRAETFMAVVEDVLQGFIRQGARRMVILAAVMADLEHGIRSLFPSCHTE